MDATCTRDGETFVLLLDEPDGWLEHRSARLAIARWSFFVTRAHVLPAETPRRWDLRSVGVDPFE